MRKWRISKWRIKNEEWVNEELRMKNEEFATALRRIKNEEWRMKNLLPHWELYFSHRWHRFHRFLKKTIKI